MYKVRVVAVREFKAVVLTKAFIISLAVMPLLMSGSMLARAILSNQTAPDEKAYAIVDHTGGEMFRRLEKAVEKRNKRDIIDPETGERTDPIFKLVKVVPAADVKRQRFELSEQVRKGELRGFVEIGAKLPEKLSKEEADLLRKARAKAGKDSISYGSELGDDKIVRYFAINKIDSDFPRWLIVRLNMEINFMRRGITAEPPSLENAAQFTEVPIVISSPLIANPLTGQIEEPKEVSIVASILMPVILVMMVFLLVMVGCSPLMQGVVEEKSQRIAEVLLASLTPFELMLGKLLGSVAVSVVLMLVYLGGGWWCAWYFGYGDYVQPGIVVWYVAFQILAILMYGALFIGVGAACTDIKETQALLMPIVALLCVPMFVLLQVIQEPDGTFATVISLIPPATPMHMVARLAVSPGIPPWQPLLGMLLVLITTVLFVFAASRVFRVGLLAQGKGASYVQIIKWIFRG
jgi:ABC-2 type transport system permease protein